MSLFILIHLKCETFIRTQVGAQDASGDNCLHLAVRCGYLPVVRYFCVNTKHSIFASIGTNGKRGEKPIEIAARLVCDGDSLAFSIFKMMPL